MCTDSSRKYTGGRPIGGHDGDAGRGGRGEISTFAVLSFPPSGMTTGSWCQTVTLASVALTLQSCKTRDGEAHFNIYDFPIS